MTRHATASVWSAFLLVLAQAWLVILSFPTTMALGPATGTQRGKHFRLRRQITIGAVSLIAVLWCVKLLLVVVTNRVYEQDDANMVQPFSGTSADVMIVSDIVLAESGSTLSLPTVSSAVSQGDSGFVFTGTAEGSHVLLSATPDVGSSGYTHLHVAEVGTDGTFVIEEDRDQFHLGDSAYTLIAFAYDETTGEKSVGSEPYRFVVRPTITERVLRSLDSIINVAVGALLLLGTSVALLLA